jgi:hypothetical protein
MTWVVDDLTHLEVQEDLVMVVDMVVRGIMDLGKALGILVLAALMVNFQDQVAMAITETNQGILAALVTLASQEQTAPVILGTSVQAVLAVLVTSVQAVLAVLGTSVQAVLAVLGTLVQAVLAVLATIQA